MMLLKFKKPLVPNFVRLEEGIVVPIERLSKIELEVYVDMTVRAIKENYEKRKKKALSEGKNEKDK